MASGPGVRCFQRNLENHATWTLGRKASRYTPYCLVLFVLLRLMPESYSWWNIPFHSHKGRDVFVLAFGIEQNVLEYTYIIVMIHTTENSTYKPMICASNSFYWPAPHLFTLLNDNSFSTWGQKEKSTSLTAAF